MPLFNAIRKLYHLSEPYGFSDAELAAAGKRLGTPLPDALRDYYRWFGRHTKVNQVQDYLILPEALAFDEDYLVIYRENQWVCQWAIRCEGMALTDPPVFIYDNMIYRQSHEKLSDFFISMAYMTAVFALPNMADEFVFLKQEAVPEIEKSFRSAGIPMPFWAGGIRFYANTDDSVLALYAAESDSPHIFWSATDEEDLQDMNAILAPIIESVSA